MAEFSTTPSALKGRTSHHINRKPASNIRHAVSMAPIIGAPLTTFVTINCARTTCPAEDVSARFSLLRLRHFGPWISRPPRQLRRAADPCAYVWVIENKGGHGLHWLVHIPADRLTDFKERLPNWLAAVGIEIECPTAIKIVPAHKPGGLAPYFLKGIDPAYAAFYYVRPEPQGLVHGKRSGFSRSLGPTVKERLRQQGRYRRTGRRFAPPSPNKKPRER